MIVQIGIQAEWEFDFENFRKWFYNEYDLILQEDYIVDFEDIKQYVNCDLLRKYGQDYNIYGACFFNDTEMAIHICGKLKDKGIKVRFN